MIAQGIEDFQTCKLVSYRFAVISLTIRTKFSRMADCVSLETGLTGCPYSRVSGETLAKVEWVCFCFCFGCIVSVCLYLYWIYVLLEAGLTGCPNEPLVGNSWRKVGPRLPIELSTRSHCRQIWAYPRTDRRIERNSSLFLDVLTSLDFKFWVNEWVSE